MCELLMKKISLINEAVNCLINKAGGISKAKGLEE